MTNGIPDTLKLDVEYSGSPSYKLFTIIATLMDTQNNPIPNAEVNFNSTEGTLLFASASSEPASKVTDGEGKLHMVLRVNANSTREILLEAEYSSPSGQINSSVALTTPILKLEAEYGGSNNRFNYFTLTATLIRGLAGPISDAEVNFNSEVGTVSPATVSPVALSGPAPKPSITTNREGKVYAVLTVPLDAVVSDVLVEAKYHSSSKQYDATINLSIPE